MSRAIAIFVALALVGLFALVNWPAFTALTPLSLGVTTMQAPLGLIMLVLLAILGVLFTVWVIALQATSLRDARRQNRELQTQRDLADKAEASRFTELRGDLLARMDRLQNDSRVALEQHANTIAAHIGELEDRLDRARLLPPDEGR